MNLRNTYKALLATTALCFAVEANATQLTNDECAALARSSDADVKLLAAELVNNPNIGAFLANLGADDAVLEAKIGRPINESIGVALDQVNFLIDPSVNPTNLITAVGNVRTALDNSTAANAAAAVTALRGALDNGAANDAAAAVTAALGMANAKIAALGGNAHPVGNYPAAIVATNIQEVMAWLNSLTL